MAEPKHCVSWGLLPHGLRLTDAPQLVRSVVTCYARRVVHIWANLERGGDLAA